MEEYMIDLESDELQHWGIKGQKWGVRRYQNTDGSLKPAGRKRYGDTPDFVKKMHAKKVQKQKVKNLEKARKAKAEKKKAEEAAQLKAEKDAKKREELLKSVDAKELYKNKHLLTNQELNERLLRLDLERRLSNNIEPSKSGTEKVTEYFDKTTKMIDASSKFYKSVDGLVTATTGKSINKHLGLDKEKVIPFDPDDFVKNMHKLSDDEFNKKYGRYTKVNLVKKAEVDKAQKIKEAEEASRQETKKDEYQKQVDDYNERWQKDGADDKVTRTSYSNPKNNNKQTSREYSKTPLLETKERYETTADDVIGEGTSARSNNTKTKPKPDDYYDPIDADFKEVSSTPVSNVPSTTVNQGRTIINGYLGLNDDN